MIWSCQQYALSRHYKSLPVTGDSDHDSLRAMKPKQHGLCTQCGVSSVNAVNRDPGQHKHNG